MRFGKRNLEMLSYHKKCKNLFQNQLELFHSLLIFINYLHSIKLFENFMLDFKLIKSDEALNQSFFKFNSFLHSQFQ